MCKFQVKCLIFELKYVIFEYILGKIDKNWMKIAFCDTYPCIKLGKYLKK